MESIPPKVFLPGKVGAWAYYGSAGTGVTTIFYPDIVYERTEFKDADIILIVRSSSHTRSH